MHPLLAKVDASVDPILNISWRRCSLSRFRPNRWLVGLTVLWLLFFLSVLVLYGHLSAPWLPTIYVSDEEPDGQELPRGEARGQEAGREQRGERPAGAQPQEQPPPELPFSKDAPLPSSTPCSTPCPTPPLCRKPARRLDHALRLGSQARNSVRSSPGPWRRRPRQPWSGQFEQDRWVALDVYSSMCGGYFVELGANDGLLFSNTVELERSFGWRGLCIEGSLPKFEELQVHRPLCSNRYAVVTADDSTVVEEVLVEDDRTGQRTEFKRAAGGGRNSTSMRTLLRGANAPTWIDFLSLDVEGFELDILNAWPWEYTIGALVVEHNFEEEKRASIRQLLREHGYVLVHAPTDGTDGCFERSPSCYPRCPCVDDWFLHPSLFIRYNATVKANSSQPPPLTSCSSTSGV
jgi:hypothetical protein